MLRARKVGVILGLVSFPMKTLRYNPIPARFYQTTRDSLAANLPEGALVVVHANDVYPTNADGTMLHHQNADLHYLTGIDQEETTLVMRISANGQHTDTLLLRETNERIVIWEGARLTKQEATELSGISDVRWSHEYQSLITEVMQSAKFVYWERDTHPRRYTDVQTRNERMFVAFRANYPNAKVRSLYTLLAKMRLVKGEPELAQLREACKITGEGFAAILPHIKPGMGEWEMEALLSCEYIRRRSRKFSFLPIIASGPDTCVLHYISNHKSCKAGDLILFDIGAEYGGYAGDMSRTVPANGRFSPRQRAVYEAVLAVHRYAASIMLPGVRKADYERRVRVRMAKELVQLGLLTAQQVEREADDPTCVRKYYMHSVSHSLGLDVHDVCPSDPVFAVGQVWTIEPGIYISEENLGVRIETDVLIHPDGVEDLIPGAPLEVADIERLMRGA